jgi:hypothetical protein
MLIYHNVNSAFASAASFDFGVFRGAFMQTPHLPQEQALISGFPEVANTLSDLSWKSGLLARIDRLRLLAPESLA